MTTNEKGEKMSCIICVFTPEKIVVSEDSAVSSDTRTYTGVEKTIPLSHDPPITISYYGNSDFDDIPLENLISEYAKKTDFKKVNTVAKVKKDFLGYAHKVMPKQSIDEYLDKKLIKFKKEISSLDENDLKYYSLIEYEKTTSPIFNGYEFDFKEMIPDNFKENEKKLLNMNLNNIFLSSLQDELSCIVIIGIDKETMKNGYANFEMLFNGENNIVICNEEEELNLKKTKLKVFAQNDVVNGFINGIDERLLSIISEDIEYYTKESLNILLKNLETQLDMDERDLECISNEIDFINKNSMIKEEFNNTLKNIEIKNKENILNEIMIMPRGEIMKMTETLINLTRLKRILSSEQVTVDGKVKHFVVSLKNGIEKFY